MAVAAAAVVGATGLLAADALTPQSAPAPALAAPEPGCEYPGPLNSQACFAAGTIRNVSLYNLQGAAQFCRWRDANPGEWARLKTYASDGQAPQQIVTWMGAHVMNDLQAYFAAGGPTFSIPPNAATNVCRTPLAAPAVQGVTPGETDVTVTIAP